MDLILNSSATRLIQRKYIQKDKPVRKRSRNNWKELVFGPPGMAPSPGRVIRLQHHFQGWADPSAAEVEIRKWVALLRE